MKYKFYALKLCLIMIIVFFVQFLSSGFTEIFLLNKERPFEIWRFFTSIFLHGGVAHLLYNIFALGLFGSILEKIIGGIKFLSVFSLTGIFSNFISINFYDSSLGASGAIFGIIGTLIILRPKLIVFAFGMPMPIFIAGILWALGDLIGIFVPSNVANIAHLSGLFFGMLIGVFLRKDYGFYENKKENLLLNENYVRDWEDRHLKN